MYNDVGGTLKILAKILAVIGIASSILVGITFIAQESEGMGFAILIGGSLISWISSFFIYGFGQLIENSDIIASQKTAENKKSEEGEKKQTSSLKVEINNESFDEEGYIDIVCPECGENLSFHKSDFLNNKELICPLCDAVIGTK